MIERNVEFKTTNFSDLVQTNLLFKRFYNNINYNVDDENYPATTKMVLKSSASLDIEIDCHLINVGKFNVHPKNKQIVNMAMIYDSINGGSIKSDDGTVIANWAELPTKYMQVLFD